MTEASSTPATKDPRRGSGKLYLRYVHPAVRRELIELARTRGWTLSQLVARLLDLRDAVLDADPLDGHAAIAQAVDELNLGRQPR